MVNGLMRVRFIQQHRIVIRAEEGNEGLLYARACEVLFSPRLAQALVSKGVVEYVEPQIENEERNTIHHAA